MAKKTTDPAKQIDVKTIFNGMEQQNDHLPIAFVGLPSQGRALDMGLAHRPLPKTQAIVEAAALTFDAEVAQMRDAGTPVNPINPFKSNKAPIWNRLEKAITTAAGKARFK